MKKMSVLFVVLTAFLLATPTFADDLGIYMGIPQADTQGNAGIVTLDHFVTKHVYVHLLGMAYSIGDEKMPNKRGGSYLAGSDVELGAAGLGTRIPASIMGAKVALNFNVAYAYVNKPYNDDILFARRNAMVTVTLDHQLRGKLHAVVGLTHITDRLDKTSKMNHRGRDYMMAGLKYRFSN